MEYLVVSDKEFKEVNNIKPVEDTGSLRYRRKEKRKKRKDYVRRSSNRKVIRSYRTYMKSPLWARRKNAYFQRHGKVCEACRDSKYVTLHHTIYRNNYGNEPDSEVVALCHKCHREFHKFCPAKKDMRKETQEFLEDMWAISQGLKELNSHSKGL